ncbi:MAG: hypothetical protein A2784_01740 [Candidatus Chisholmbacteria bacterium RIFCSPHIGHO2_01_FULL_48_12]|uniref:Uncharacterized protein n=1 Tax=Candidatus Chisholmbacteria bacterium RIFCSPHIGHO2_01_FULL_48_12 TaxID=1797589 RepID=A0A1G1VR83_9BACT|nr:MAG: hypothetical protein A2784_01740 [Candidatus Chisholmbacteria bacterium RIFCSPHIGHO2_01_FULL_48_12]
MATLTQTAYYTRRTLKWGSFLVLFLIVFRWAWNGFITYWLAKHPPPPPPPTVAFGKLPQLQFPDQTKGSLTFKLETVTGTTPDLGDRAHVFFMPAKRANLLALERATTQAARLGFNLPPQKLTDTLYRWANATPLSTNLDLDIIYGHFLLTASWQQDPTLLDAPNLPNTTPAVIEAQDYLADAGLLPEDLKTGRTQVSFLRASANDFIPAPSLSEAEFVQVDLFRQDLPAGKVYTATPSAGLVRLIFSGNTNTGKRIVSLAYNYFPVNYDQSATYPLKASSQAWAELQSGQGYIATLPTTGNQATVRRVSLGFYDAPTPQTFLQPIYVFEGDNNFVAYVPALDSKWVE